MRTLLFSFDDGTGTTYHNVYVDDTDPSIISFKQFNYASGEDPYPTYSEGDQIGTPQCQGTTKTYYTYTASTPFAKYHIEYNSPYCGFSPPVCDLTIKNIKVTNQTEYGVSNGVISIFATSSALPILYQIVTPVSAAAGNSTGYFTGLDPDTYLLVLSDQNGCQIRTTVIVGAFDPNATRFKYKLAFDSVKTDEYYELRLLDQKNFYDATQYPKNLTGTDAPVVRKTTNSNEDKTSAFNVSSLDINVYVDGSFDVKEFSLAEERDWKVEIWRKNANQVGLATFNLSLTEDVSPFIDGNIQLRTSGNTYDINSTGTLSETGIVGQTFAIEITNAIVPVGTTAPKLNATITKNGDIVFRKTLPANGSADMTYIGTNDKNSVYHVIVTTTDNTPDLHTININDAVNYGKYLDWQGWLLPDELQDYYSDPDYPIQLTATDGILSLQGSTFGDPSLYQTDSSGNVTLNQLFGIRAWIYLIKICLDQLGYDYGKTKLISSLTYLTYDVNQWLNYGTWADIFYDENGVPKDTYSSLQLLLQAFHLQLFQHKGGFIIWDINDIYYRNNTLTPITPYVFEFADDFSTVSLSTDLPAVLQVGYLKQIEPINPKQPINYDKAFNVLEADINFNLLSLLYPNPSFEFNATQGILPDGFSKNGTINAYLNYDPPTNIIGSGAFLGNWELRIQSNWDPAYNYGNYIYITTPINIDQPNKKLNFSYYWRAYATGVTNFPNTLPVNEVVFIGVSGTKYSWWIQANGTSLWKTETSEPVTHSCSPNVQISDFIAWNSFSFTTDVFPEGSGALNVRFGWPSAYTTGGSSPLPMGTPLQVDIDQFVLTVSDANDAYNFQTGEKHIVTNSTSYAKAEKKTVDLGLFTYPNNKRIAGNVGNAPTYAASQVSNDWFFKLSTEQLGDRLPANVIRRIAKNYQQPMYKWQGDVSSDDITFYAVFVINGIDAVFVAFTTEIDLRNSTGNLVLIATDDSQMQSQYAYTPVYEKSARNNIS